MILPGRPRSATQPATDPSDDPRNDVNGQPLLPSGEPFLPLVQLHSLDAADVYGGPIVYYPPCYNSCYSYSGGCYSGRSYGYGSGLGYGYGYGGFRGSFGGFHTSGGGLHGSSFGGHRGSVGGGSSHGHNFASRR